jgi:hypothetical protein
MAVSLMEGSCHMTEESRIIRVSRKNQITIVGLKITRL